MVRSNIGQNGTNVVGARAYKYVLADLQATAKEIASLAKKRPMDALAHPNCPPEVWWDLAPRHPIEALASTAGALYLLEDPTRWMGIEREHSFDWTLEYACPLDDNTLRLFLCDCIEHVLPFYVADPKTPPEYRGLPATALAAVRRFATGKGSAAKIKSVLAEAKDTPVFLRGQMEYVIPAIICLLAAERGEYMDDYPRKVIADSVMTLIHTSGYNTDIRNDKIWHDLFAQESVWQWRHLLTYLLPRQSSAQ